MSGGGWKWVETEAVDGFELGMLMLEVDRWWWKIVGGRMVTGGGREEANAKEWRLEALVEMGQLV